MRDQCNHPRCYGGPCKSLTLEELTPSSEDVALAKVLIAEGWKSISTKYRMIARHVTTPTGRDLVRPELHDTEYGRFVIDWWDHHWRDHLLRLRGMSVETRELTVRQYRAFRTAGGIPA